MRSQKTSNNTTVDTNVVVRFLLFHYGQGNNSTDVFRSENKAWNAAEPILPSSVTADAERNIINPAL